MFTTATTINTSVFITADVTTTATTAISVTSATKSTTTTTTTSTNTTCIFTSSGRVALAQFSGMSSSLTKSSYTEVGCSAVLSWS